MKITYAQNWKAYTLAQTSEGIRFDNLLRDLVNSVKEPEQRMGRPRLNLRETLFCAIQKVYSQLSSRRAHSLYKRAEVDEKIGHAPHFNAISKLLNREESTSILHKLITISAQPLKAVETDFAVDSSGFRTTTFGEYAEKKYALHRSHRWVKAHICIGVKTNVIVGVEITDEHSADSKQFEPLVQKIADGGFEVREVSADKAYSSKASYEAVRKVGGQAFIPFKTNATGKSRGSMLWKKMYLYFQLRQEEFMAHYNKRSNAETTFHMIKSKFGDKLKSKNPIAQRNELLCKVLSHNIVVLIHEMEELGVSPYFLKQRNL